MISDPKTTPTRARDGSSSPAVAFGGWYINYRLSGRTGILWSLAGAAILVPSSTRCCGGALTLAPRRGA